MCGNLLLLFLVMSSIVYAHAQNTESDDRLDCENKCADEVINCFDLYVYICNNRPEDDEYGSCCVKSLDRCLSSCAAK